MNNYSITTHEELKQQINHLKIKKAQSAEDLKKSLVAFFESIDPVSVIKGSLHALASDKTVRTDIAKVGLNMGANIIIDKILGKHQSIKGFLSALLVEKISSEFINNNFSHIVAGISKMMNKNTAANIHSN